MTTREENEKRLPSLTQLYHLYSTAAEEIDLVLSDDWDVGYKIDYDDFDGEFKLKKLLEEYEARAELLKRLLSWAEPRDYDN